MTRFTLRLLPVAALMLGLTAMPALASKAPTSFPGVLKVEDEAGLFSAAGIAKAKGEFEAITFHSPTHLYVYSTSKIPADKLKDFDAVKSNKDQRRQFFRDWAKELAKSKDRKGDVFLLLYKNDKAYIATTVADEQSDVHGHFKDESATAVATMLNDAMRDVHDGKLTADAAHAKMDVALVKATERVISDLKERPALSGNHSVNAAHGGDNGGGRGIMGYVCIGLACLLGAWLVIGLIRAFTGGGGGGGGMGGGGYGGGGGGFMSSMLGGMFGAAAGMYLYDQFSGHHSSSNDLGASNSYGDGGTTDTGDGNYDGGSSGAADGGDWGDSGGDTGGGGDWGGGGDVGGGDFGGGDW